MVKQRVNGSHMSAMGQISSQPNRAPGTENEVEQEGSTDKQHQSDKRKRKSAEAGENRDEEQSQQQSARALLQLREGTTDRIAHGYGDDLAASQQLVTESSQPRSPRLSNGAVTVATSSQKSKKHQKSNKKTTKKQSRAETDPFTPNHDGDGASRYAELPSTPPGQTDRSSPLSYRPSVSQSHHALDEVPTDDEAAIFDQEFGNSAASDEPTTPVPDIYSFSQQPPETHSQQESMEPPYQLPVHTHASNSLQKHKKRKRQSIPVSDIAAEKQMPPANGNGQYTFAIDSNQQFSTTYPDTHLYHDRSFADAFDELEGNEIPIDPELHSVSALPPAADLSALDNGGANVRPTKTRKSKLNGSIRPKKRRRIEDTAPGLNRQDGHNNPYSMHNDQENIQDRVLPGIEDMQRQTSPELRTPFMEDIARGGLKYLNNASNSAEDAKRKGTKEKPESTHTTQPKSSPKEKQSKRSIKDVSSKGGTFTPAEFAKLDNFRDRYCDANKITYGHFNTLIQTHIKGNPEVTTLFNEIHELIPYRPRLSVQKCVRRRFHNYAARGTWTAEEDEELRQAVEEKGKSWKVVGEMIDRMPGDCRDRWRNYLFKSENRQREQWTDEEVKALCAGILDCIQTMKAERQQAKVEKYGSDASQSDEDSDQEAEDMKLINWQTVSDHMDNGRSRLQCSLKWGQIKRNDMKSALRRIREAGGLQAPRISSTKNKWRRRLAAKRTANMRIGDRYALVQAIFGCNASTEGNIPWLSLGDDQLRATWIGPEKKLAWQKLKKSIPDSDSTDYRVVANQLIMHIEAEAANELDDRWDPEVHGDVSKRKKSRKARDKGQAENVGQPQLNGQYQAKEQRRTSAISNKFVHESDDEDEVDDAQEPQDHNRYNVLPRSEQANRYADINAQPASTSEDEGELDHTGDAHDSDQDSLFNEKFDDNQPQSIINQSVSPDMASKIQSLRSFM